MHPRTATRKRPYTVAARVDELEIALIRTAASEQGVNVATFVATAALDRAKRQLAVTFESDAHPVTEPKE